MTSNIWGDYFGNPVTIREDELYDVYCRYVPDVIGLQEATVAWHQSTLFSRLKKEYTEVDVQDTVTEWYIECENDEGVIRVHSEGYAPDCVALTALDVQPDEIGTSAA